MNLPPRNYPDQYSGIPGQAASPPGAPYVAHATASSPSSAFTVQFRFDATFPEAPWATPMLLSTGSRPARPSTRPSNGRENNGCRGADGVTVERFAADLETELDHLQGSLLRGSYRPFPLLRFEIPKPSSGLRSLCVPTVRDRVLQSAVYLITREVFEAEFEDASHAYRQGRSVRTAVHRIHQLRDQGYRFVVDADIDAFSTASRTSACSPASPAWASTRASWRSFEVPGHPPISRDSAPMSRDIYRFPATAFRGRGTSADFLRQRSEVAGHPPISRDSAPRSRDIHRFPATALRGRGTSTDFPRQRSEVPGHPTNFPRQRSDDSGHPTNFPRQRSDVTGHPTNFPRQRSDVSGHPTNFSRQRSDVPGSPPISRDSAPVSREIRRFPARALRCPGTSADFP